MKVKSKTINIYLVNTNILYTIIILHSVKFVLCCEIAKLIVQKYEDLEETDMETSLILTSEGGHFLLKENSNLKNDKAILLNTNTDLQTKLKPCRKISKKHWLRLKKKNSTD